MCVCVCVCVTQRSEYLSREDRTCAKHLMANIRRRVHRYKIAHPTEYPGAKVGEAKKIHETLFRVLVE